MDDSGRADTADPEHSLVHHSDAGSPTSFRGSTNRLTEAGISPSVGSVGDSYDNALAESVIGLYKTTNSSARKDHGATSTRSSTPPSNTSTGSTTPRSSNQ